MPPVTITLTHLDIGLLRVRICEAATWRNRQRTWVCADDPELGEFHDTRFEEAPPTINRLMLKARNDQIASSPIAREGVEDRLSSFGVR